MIGLKIIEIIIKDFQILELIILHLEDNQLDKINHHHSEEEVQWIEILDKKDLDLKWEHQQQIQVFMRSLVDFTKVQISKSGALQATIQTRLPTTEKAKWL